MKSLLIAASVLALSTPAFAQMEPATPAQTTTAPMPGESTAPKDVAPAPAATPDDAKALIASEFPIYDKDTSGNLDKTEFAAWMGALKAKTDAKPMPASEMKKWSDGAFATADTDKSKTVTLAELQTYLTKSA